MQEKVQKLKETISKFDTRDLLRSISMALMTIDSHPSKSDLDSPFMQYFYLLGLHFSSSGVGKHKYRPSDHFAIVETLKDVTNEYARLFLTDTKIDKAKAELVLPVFLNYFNTYVLTERNQIHAMLTYYAPQFSAKMLETFGFDIGDCIVVSNQVDATVGRQTKELVRKVRQVQKTTDWLKDLESMRESFCSFTLEIFHGLLPQNQAEKVLQQFTIQKERRDYFWYTDSNPFGSKPLWRDENQNYVFTLGKVLDCAILEFVEGFAKSNGEHQIFLRMRDRYLEDLAAKTLKRLFRTGTFFRNTYQKSNHREHDLVVSNSSSILVVECKASPHREPFRDVGKCYTRIHDSFCGKTGPGYGYQQAIALVDEIRSCGQLELLDNNKNILVSEPLGDRVLIPVVITLDHWGILNTNVTVIPEFEALDIFPLSFCIFDLELLVNKLLLDKMSHSFLVQYYLDKNEIYKKIKSTDELEVLGYYHDKRNFSELKKYETVTFTPEMSSIFEVFG